MAWIDEAIKHTTEPVAILEIALDSGTLKYAVDYVRPTNASPYIGNILKLPMVSNSIGDLVRRCVYSNIEIEFSDTDRTFRKISEGIKNRAVILKIPFINKSLATDALTIFKGQIYDWDFIDNLRFKLICEQVQKNYENEYPDKYVELEDYPNAHSSAIEKLIPVPYGIISALGLSNDGAHPTLFVDTTTDSEKYLIGRQNGAITVNRVYIDRVLKTEGAGDDYQISTQVIDGKTYTEIHWNAGVNPTASNKVTCDIQYGSICVCEAIKDKMKNFCGYVDGDFHAASYNTAHQIEQNRELTLDGSFDKRKKLKSWLDIIKDEFELDIWTDPKDGLVHFKYLSADVSVSNHYKDYVDILAGYSPKRQVTKMMNYLDYYYNYNYADKYFHSHSIRENADSQTKHNATFKEEKKYYFVRSSMVATQLAARRIMRRKDPIVLDTFLFPLKTFNNSLGDVIEITHYEGDGSSGYEQKKFQIRKTDYNLDKFTNKMILEDISQFLWRCCQVGPITVPDYTLATKEEQDKYLFACDDTTGQFSNGDPGKIACD